MSIRDRDIATSIFHGEISKMLREIWTRKSEIGNCPVIIVSLLKTFVIGFLSFFFFLRHQVLVPIAIAKGP